MKKLHLLFLLSLAAALPLTAAAAAPPYPFSTGVDGNGQQRPKGDLDSHWTVRTPTDSTPTPASINPYNAWVAAPADANWVSSNFDSTASAAAGDYYYTTKFDLTGQDPSKISITGKWACDNNGTEILLNGSSVGITTAVAEFSKLYDFAISSAAHFVAGVNTITFHVVNSDVGAANPTGLLVEFAPPPVPPVCVARPAGLVAEYSGDGNAADSAGNNNGTLKNGATFAAGKVGRAFKLDGVDDFIQIPNSPSLNPVKITLEAWVNPASIKAGSRIISKDLHASSCSVPTVTYSLETRGLEGGRAVLFFTTADNAFHEVSGTSVIPTGVFTHVAATYDGSTAKIYVNGVLENSVSASGPLQTTSDTPVVIGSGGPACRTTNGGEIEFHGLIDEVGVYNRALSTAEVKAINDAGTAGKCDAAGQGVDLILGQKASTAISPNGSAVRPGEIITYILNLYNGGTAGATGVTVIDGLPSHTTFVSADNGGHLNKNKQVEFDLGTLAPGQANKKYLTIKARANSDAPLNRELVNNNYGVFADGVPTVQGRDIIRTLVAGPVTVETSASTATISPGGVITYTFTVKNPQPVTAQNVQIGFPLPDNAKVNFVTGPGAVVTSTDVTFNLGDVAPNATFTLTVSLQMPYDVVPGSAPLVLSAVKVSADVASGRVAFFLDPITTKLVPGTAKPPQLGLIKIIPDGVTLRQLAFVAALTGNDIFASFKKVFPAIDSSDGIDALARIVNPDVSDSTAADGNFLQLVTTPGQANGPKQTFISYALIYTNATATAANNAFIQDRVPEGTKLVAGSAALDGQALPVGMLVVTDSGRTLTFDLNTLKAATHLITYKVRVLSRAEGGLAAGAKIQARGSYIASSSLFHTSSATPEETDVLLRGIASAAIESSKTTANGSVGDVVGYDIFYHNTGNVAAGDFRILDPIPAGTSFVSAVLLDDTKKVRGVDPSRNESIDHPAAGSKTGTVTYHLGPVPPGEFGFVRLQVKVEPSAKTVAGLVYTNKAHYAADSFPQAASSGEPALSASAAQNGASTNASTLDSGSESYSIARLTAGDIPRLGIGMVAPLAVRAGDTFEALVFLCNPSNTDVAKSDLVVLIPPGTEYVSSSDPGGIFNGYKGTDKDGRPAVIFEATVRDDATHFVDATVHAHDSLRRKVTFRALATSAGKSVFGRADTEKSVFNKASGASVAPVHSPEISIFVYPADQPFESAREQIVASALAAEGFNTAAETDRPDFKAKVANLSTKATHVVLGGVDYLPLNNGAVIVPLLNGNVLAAGPAGSLVASGGGNVISNDGGSLVASGGGNLIKITNLISNDGGSLISKDGKFTSTLLANLISQDGGNLVAQGGGNLVASGGGNLISQDGGALISNDGGGLTPLNVAGLVASGGGNLVASGGGNLVASGGGNLVASGGGNLVASGGGNLVASGGGNLVASGGGNLVASGGGNLVSPDASRAVLLGGNGLVASGGGNIVASGGGN